MNEKNKNKKNGPSAIAVGALFLIIGLLNSDMGEDGAAIAIAVIVAIAVLVSVVAAAKKKKGALPAVSRGTGASPFSTAKSAFTASARPAYTRSAAAKPSAAQRVVVPASRGDRYIEQLNGFLKNGIIDRAEYEFLLKRWTSRKK